MDPTFSEIRLDDGFDALPKQDKPKKIGNGHLQFGELVPDPPRWMSWAQRAEYYKKDLADFLGDYAGGIEEMPMSCNFKRSSRPEKKKKKSLAKPAP